MIRRASWFAIAPRVSEGIAKRRGLGRRALRYRTTQIGIALTAALVVIAAVGPLLAPYSPTALGGLPFAGPSAHHWLGLDFLGRDALSRFLNGGRSVIALSFLATTIGEAAGTVVGLAAGYSRNWIDSVLMRIGDALISFPAVILVLVLLSAVGPKLWLVVGGVALVNAPRVARIVRAATLELIPQDFIQAAEARGERLGWLFRREVLPNILTPILVDFGLRLSGSVIMIASVSFLGFGIQPPRSDWGLMINENRQGLTVQPYVVLFPALAIALLTIGTNMIADGVARAAGRHAEAERGGR
jgi:peptide/nickel transport system permease protein